MHPLGKCRKWRKEDAEKQNSEHSIHPRPPLQIPTQSNNRKDRREKRKSRHAKDDLTRDDMLLLLSILEGELQARDEVITLLKLEKTDPALLEAHYSSNGHKALRALQRDSLHTQHEHLQDVCTTPVAEVPKPNNLITVQMQASTWEHDQFLQVSNSQSDALHRLKEQQRNHEEFVHDNFCLTTVLEEDRKRLKLLIEKQNQYQEFKEKIHEEEVLTLTEELKKLKAFAVVVIKEQQRMREHLEEQRCQVEELTAIADHLRQVTSVTFPAAEEEGLESVNTEVQQHNPFFNIWQIHHTMSDTLTDGMTQNLCQRQFVDLEGKINNGREIGPKRLLSEVEVLRRRLIEMEGKDEDLIHMRDQCQELDQRLAREIKHCCSLKVEVDKLNGRICELDRIEEALSKSKQEGCVLRDSLEKEREMGKRLSDEVDSLRVRVMELEAIEGQLEKSEAAIRQDMAKLRSMTVVLVEDRNNMADRLQKAEEKLSRNENKKNEQSNLTMTEKLKVERQQMLRSKADLEERIMGIVKENDDLRARVTTEKERNDELQSKISIMKKRLQVLENWKEKEKYTQCSSFNSINHQCQKEENKVKKLTQELDRLQKALRNKEMLEKQFINVEEDFKLLEKKFKDEQTKSDALANELEGAKRELSGYQQVEKEEVNQEHLLLCHLQKEQVKSRLLGREVETLKEKLKTLMETNESICRIQADHSVLRGKLTQQEARNTELAIEMGELRSELDRYRRIKNLSTNNLEPVSNIHQTDKEVQTEPAGDTLFYKYSGQVACANDEELQGKKDEKDANHNVQMKHKRGLPTVNHLNSLNSANNIVSQKISHSTNGTSMQQTVNGEVMMMTHTPGQPLHIKVTPNHILNTATLEISGPTADAATSYTSTAVIPSSGAQPNQKLTIIQNSASPSMSKTHDSSPDFKPSALNGTQVSQILSLNSLRSVAATQNNSSVQILTVGTYCPEVSHIANEASFCKTPERQGSWQHLRSNSQINNSPNIITTDDNKIHIHLGTPYFQSHSLPESVAPCYLRHEQRTHVLTDGCRVKGAGRVTSSITISPATSPISHSPS